MTQIGKEGLFDLIGDLREVYEEAKKVHDDELVQTLDILGLWEEVTEVRWLYRVWKAMQGDTIAERETAWAFDWSYTEPEKVNAKYDHPELAVYWYEKAAKADDSIAQCNLANLYCSERLPQKFWNGKRAVYWREKSVALKDPHGMRGLAYCLKCGLCCKGGRDIARANELLAEADAILKSQGEE